MQQQLKMAAPSSSESGNSVQATLAIFDREDLIERLMSNEDLAKRVVSRFLKDLPAHLAALSQSVEHGDLEGSRTLAHTLKGSSANVSGLSLANASAELEKALRAGNLPHAKSLFIQLSAKAQETIDELSRFSET